MTRNTTGIEYSNNVTRHVHHDHRQINTLEQTLRVIEVGVLPHGSITYHAGWLKLIDLETGHELPVRAPSGKSSSVVCSAFNRERQPRQST
jgi:hypothetical protein